MIRQICLSCYKTVELPDETAGKETPCPSCGKAIAVPAKYTAGVAEGGGVPLPPVPPPTPSLPPPPPPGPRSGAPPMTEPPVTPPGLKSEAVPPAPPPPPPEGGLTRGFGCALNPVWLDWVPVACLLLACVLSFLPWVSMNLGGYTVMTQNGWETVFAAKGDATPKGKQWEELDKVLAGKPTDDKYKDAFLRTDWLVLLYLLLLLGLVVLFAAERVVQDPAKFPPLAGQKWLPPIWKWRLAVLGGLAVLAFAVLWFQALQGFGLQKAITTYVQTDVKEKLTAPNQTDAEKREIWVEYGQRSGILPVYQTFWLKLLLVLHAVAVVAVAGRFWLDLRGNKPLPRADVRW